MGLLVDMYGSQRALNFAVRLICIISHTLTKRIPGKSLGTLVPRTGLLKFESRDEELRDLHLGIEAPDGASPERDDRSVDLHGELVRSPGLRRELEGDALRQWLDGLGNLWRDGEHEGIDFEHPHGLVGEC